MKKILIILIAFSAIACKKDVKVDYAIVSGVIQNNLGPESLGLYSMDRALIKTLKMSKEGKFLDTIKVDMNNYILYDGANPIFVYLDSAYNVSINYDVNKLDESLVISGEGSQVSNYLIKKKAIEGEHLKGSTAFYKYSESQYKELFDKIADEQINLLTTSPRIPESYIIQEERNINYFYLSMLADYQPAHRHFTKNQTFQVSDSFLTELETIEYDSYEDYLFSPYYKRLVNNHYQTKVQNIARTKGLQGGLAVIEAYKEAGGELKNKLMFDFVNANLTRERNIKAVYEAYMENSSNEEQKLKITEIYERLNISNPGEPSPKFVDYENYAGGTTSLDDLKGKYVYIDVWATWCGPCIKEIPALKSIENEFHGKNIEFVSISIDKEKDHDKWRQMIKDRDLKGIQLLADNDWKSSFVQDYSIKGIPRFILLDPEGNIVNSNAPRPSSPGLKTLFESLKI